MSEWIRSIQNKKPREPASNKGTGQYYDSAKLSRKPETLSVFIFF
jgi:hypothetical protein